MFASLSFGSPTSVVFDAIALVVGSGLVVRGLRRAPLSARARLACAALKVTALLLLAVVLVEPLWSSTRAVPGENLVVLLADDSRSLAVPESVAGPDPAAALRRVLTDSKSDWQRRLAEDFDVRRFRCDARLHPTEDFHELAAQGDATQIVAALASLRDRFRGRPVAGVVLFTDGTSSDLLARAAAEPGLPPVYPVLLRQARGDQLDVSVEAVTVNRSPFEDAPVTIQADVAARNVGGAVIRARLVQTARVRGEERLVAEQTQPPAEETGRASFRFELRPETTGPQFYTVDVAAVRADEPLAELTLENNRRLVCVNHAAGRHRVLYVSGRPNWEFKFLNRAVAGDDQIQLAALIRIARREAKFDFRGRAGESSNPLFRGFKKSDSDETERYDEPVIVRLNMKDGSELRVGFPKTADDLYGFRAVILDDVEAGFFTHDQLALLETFVSERGGGLLMLGGQESFAEGGYAKSPLAPVLPVYLDKASATTASAATRMQLTRDGWLLSWARLRRTETEERQRLDRMPAFRTVNAVTGVRPGAIVVATAEETAERTATPQAALAFQRYGRGVGAALTVGDLWRWQLRRQEGSDDLAKAWRQMLRFLVADVSEMFDLKATPVPGDVDGRVRIELRARDRAFRPLDNADVRFHVTAPAGETVAVAAEASTEEAGLYRAEFVPTAPGGYVAEATASEADGRELARVQTGWAHDPAAEEFRTLAPQREALDKLAAATGGELLTLDDLAGFARRLPKRHVPVAETLTWPLWHNGWCLLLLVGCLSGEWALRRKLGLP